MRVRLLGGWGYFNLGDEALLAGYLEELAGVMELEVGSVDPARTASAQRHEVSIFDEGRLPSAHTISILGGGGYLNGSWLPEIRRKLRRLTRDVRGGQLITHAVEVRGFAGTPLEKAATSLLHGAVATVRDMESAKELNDLGVVDPVVVPDAISLLAPHLDRYRRPIPELKKGKVLFNLLDVARRPDARECELDPAGVVELGRDLVARLGDRAVGLVIGEGDAERLRWLGDLPIVAPRSVAGLVSALGSADAVYTVRMHPGLIASALGIPTVAVPYCGKVRPTLERVGTTRTILENLDSEAALDSLRQAIDFTEEWSAASQESRRALHNSLTASAP